MNYIAEINAFHARSMEVELKAPEQALWFALMDICNRTGWKEEFNVSILRLALASGMSEAAVRRARKRLEEFGFITVEVRRGSQSAVYHMVSLTEKAGSTPPLYESERREKGPSVERAGGIQPDGREIPPETAERDEVRPEAEMQPEAAVLEEKETAGNVFANLYDWQIERQTERQTDRIHKTINNTLSLFSAHEGFSAFWSVYPNRKSRKKAWEQYARLVGAGVPARSLQDAASNYADYVRACDVPERYQIHPDNWLRDERYIDFLPENYKITAYKKPAPPNKNEGAEKVLSLNLNIQDIWMV